jgi:hypothetical protein
MAIFTAIGAGIFGAGTFLAGLTAATLQVAAGIGISLIAKSLAGEPEKAKFGVKGKLQGGDDIPRSILFGYNCTAGSLVYGNTWGVVDGLPNAYLTNVIALADYPIRELVEVEVNGAKCTLGALNATLGYPVLEFRKNGRDHLWVKFYDGTQTTADPFLVNTVSSAERPYTSNRIGFGIPYVITTALAHQRNDGEEESLFSGFPTFKFVTNGAKLYDISRDSSAGGSGAQRFNNPATWGGDGDFLPAVQIYNLLRGIRFGGEWLYGLQKSTTTNLPNESWIAAINKCRAPIRGESGLEPTYRTGGEIQVGAQIKFAIESILTGCQGRLSEIGGVYKLSLGEPEAASVSFTDEDILSTEDQTFTPFFTLEDTINGIQATYPNPSESWNSKTAPPLYRTDLEALSGGRRLLADVTLDMVPYPGQVQRLMKSALAEAQRARRHTLTMGPEFWILEPGDIISWTSERNGYQDKLFRVDGMADKDNLDILMDITEVDPSDYSWNQDTDFRPVVNLPIQLVTAPALPMIGWQVYAVAIKDELNRERKPAIEIWYQSGIQDVDRVKFQVRRFGDTEIFLSGEVPYGNPWRTIIQGEFPADSEFEVRGIFVRNSGGLSEWSDWLYVKTLNVKLIPGIDFDPYEGVVNFESLEDDLAGYFNWIGQNVREIIEQQQEQALLTNNQELANSLQFTEVRTQISQAIGDLSATFEETITVAIVPLNGRLVALADAITTLSAGDGFDLNTSRFRLTALSGPAGYSRIGAETRYSNTDTLDWRGAAWYLDTPNNPSLPTRFLVNADQFVVVSPAGNENPLIYDGTALRLNVANIGTVNAGIIQGTNVLINLNTGFFSFG